MAKKDEKPDKDADKAKKKIPKHACYKAWWTVLLWVRDHMGRKAIGIWTAYHVLFCIGGIIGAARVPSSFHVGLPLVRGWSVVIWHVLCLIISLLGLVAAITKRPVICRIYFFLMPALVVCLMPVVISLSRLTCTCDNWQQCRALRHYVTHFQDEDDGYEWINPFPTPEGKGGSDDGETFLWRNPPKSGKSGGGDKGSLFEESNSSNIAQNPYIAPHSPKIVHFSGYTERSSNHALIAKSPSISGTTDNVHPRIEPTFNRHKGRAKKMIGGRQSYIGGVVELASDSMRRQAIHDVLSVEASSFQQVKDSNCQSEIEETLSNKLKAGLVATTMTETTTNGDITILDSREEVSTNSVKSNSGAQHVNAMVMESRAAGAAGIPGRKGDPVTPDVSGNLSGHQRNVDRSNLQESLVEGTGDTVTPVSSKSKFNGTNGYKNGATLRTATNLTTSSEDTVTPVPSKSNVTNLTTSSEERNHSNPQEQPVGDTVSAETDATKDEIQNPQEQPVGDTVSAETDATKDEIQDDDYYSKDTGNNSESSSDKGSEDHSDYEYYYDPSGADAYYINKEGKREKVTTGNQYKMTYDTWLKFLIQRRNNTCHCREHGSSCAAYHPDGDETTPSSFWCEVDKDMKNVCEHEKKGRAIKDLKPMPKKRGGHFWSVDLCAKKKVRERHGVKVKVDKGRCKCWQGQGYKVKGAEKDKVNPKFIKAANGSEDILIGQICDTWFKEDTTKWCVVGFDTACADRKEILIDPASSLRMWRSSLPCTKKSRKEHIHKGASLCFKLQFAYYILDIPRYVLFPVFFIATYMWLSRNCMDDSADEDQEGWNEEGPAEDGGVDSDLSWGDLEGESDGDSEELDYVGSESEDDKKKKGKGNNSDSSEDDKKKKGKDKKKGKK